MKHGYVRLTKRGASERTQHAAVAGAGVDAERIHVDDQRKPVRAGVLPPLTNRAAALRGVREGDVLVIHTAGRLGTSRDEIRAVLKTIGERGGQVLEVATGALIGSPEIAALIEFEKRAYLEVEQERTAPARKAKADVVAKKLTAKQAAILLPMWRDVENHTPVSVQDAAAEIGVKVSRRSLYNLLGNRVVPK